MSTSPITLITYHTETQISLDVPKFAHLPRFVTKSDNIFQSSVISQNMGGYFPNVGVANLKKISLDLGN